MSDSEFWRDLASQFLALDDPAGSLYGDWYYRVNRNEPGAWTLRGPATIQAQFDSLARRGAMRISAKTATDLLDAWLEAIRKDGDGFRVSATGISRGEEVSGKDTEIMFGEIRGLRNASVNYCKKLESAALQMEFEEKQKADPQNWSPVRRQFEAFRSIRQLIDGHHETIPEALVRNALAAQLGIKPDEVTWQKIRFEVAALLPYYPAITLVSYESEVELAQDTTLEGETEEPPVEASMGEEIERRSKLLSEYKAATNNTSNKRIYEARNSGIH